MKTLIATIGLTAVVAFLGVTASQIFQANRVAAGDTPAAEECTKSGCGAGDCQMAKEDCAAHGCGCGCAK